MGDLPIASETIELALVDKAFEYRHDPDGFIRFAFNAIPDPWQHRVLMGIKNQLFRQKHGYDLPAIIRHAVAIGQGAGKTTLVCWLVLWALTTKTSCQCVVVTATKHWLGQSILPALPMWCQRSKFAHWFVCSDQSIQGLKEHHKQGCRADGLIWDGQTQHVSPPLELRGDCERSVVLMDHVMEIPDRAWEVVDEQFSGLRSERIWVVVGTPLPLACDDTVEGVRLTQFKRCFFEDKGLWTTANVDCSMLSGIS